MGDRGPQQCAGVEVPEFREGGCVCAGCGGGAGAGIRRVYVKVQPLCEGLGARAVSGRVRARAPLPACLPARAAWWV